MKKVNKTTPSVSSKCIKSKEGETETLTEEHDILERWKEYGTSLFERPARNMCSSTTSVDLNLNELEPEPLINEVEAAVKQLKCRKSPGLDNIPG